MPELDELFTHLADSASIRPRTASAGEAIRRHRRRRTRNALASAALAMALIGIGTAVLGPHLRAGDAAIATQDRGLPAAHVLDAATLNTATAGWIQGWRPYGPRDQIQNRLQSLNGCLASRFGFGYDPGQMGFITYVTGANVQGESAFYASLIHTATVGPDGRPAWTLTMSQNLTDDCLAPGQVLTYADGSTATTYPASKETFVLVRSPGALALAFFGGTSTGPTAQAETRVADALRAALADPHSFASDVPAAP